MSSIERPFVYVNMAMTADGKITSAAREYPTFTSGRDKKTMDRLRAEADAILIGAGTLRADDPPLGVRDPEARTHRLSLGKQGEPIAVVVSASLELDPGARFFTAGASARIVATIEDAPAERAERLSGHAELWRLGRGRVDLPALLSRLLGRGVLRLLVEGGGEINWQFLDQDLVDELYVTVAPSVLGGRSAPTPVGGAGWSMDSRVRLRLVSADRHGDELYCRYEVARREAPGEKARGDG